MNGHRRVGRRVRSLAMLAIVAVIAGATTSSPVAAQDARAVSSLAPAAPDRPVEVELRSAARTLVPGATVPVAIRLRPNPGWHTYWRHAGDVGSAPVVTWHLPDGFAAEPLRWPAPELIEAPPLASYGYEREVHLLGAIQVPHTARVGSQLTLGATVTWVVCEVECVAGDVDVALTLPVATSPVVDSAAARALAAEADRVPESRAGWTFRAAVDSNDVVLRVRPLKGQWPVVADGEKLHFFVDAAGIVDHASPVEVRAAGSELELRQRRSPYAAGSPDRLLGVLTLWAASDGSRAPRLALEVDAPVVAMAQLAGVPGFADGSYAGGVAVAGGWLALLTAGLLALLGGTLLNLMPCVLPVLSIKALGLADVSAGDARAARRHALLFGAGVLVSMWALVAVLLALRAAGAEVGWGYQLQSPVVVGALALLIFAAALNMAGVFELVPVGGVLVTALATPCSAPFLATAVGFALTGGAARAFVVFTALGLGLIWPLAAVAMSPRLRRWIPRPGAWMVTLRQVLAFPLIATVVWLAWVLGRQAGVNAVTALLAALTLLAFGLWALGRFGTLGASTPRRRVAQGIALVAGGGALALMIVGANASADTMRPRASGAAGATSRESANALPWQPYSAAALEALRDSGRVVLLDFTADWCLTCKVNERVAFGSEDVREAVQTHDVALLRADWTTRDPLVTRALAAFGRNSVPFVVVYGRDHAAAPEILPTLLTPGIVTRALAAAAATPPTHALSASVLP